MSTNNKDPTAPPLPPPPLPGNTGAVQSPRLPPPRYYHHPPAPHPHVGPPSSQHARGPPSYYERPHYESPRYREHPQYYRPHAHPDARPTMMMPRDDPRIGRDRERYVPQPRGGIFPSKSGAFVRYQPQRFVPVDHREGMIERVDHPRDGPRDEAPPVEPPVESEKEVKSDDDGKETKADDDTKKEASEKRPRSPNTVDDRTPKAGGAYRHPGGFFPNSSSQSTKRMRLGQEFKPAHRRSFSLESECRQDKPARRGSCDSPAENSLSSRFDFYGNGEERSALCRSHSWNEGRSRSMSWEVPAALSAIGSFGQLNNDSLRDHREEGVDADMPLPVAKSGGGGFPLAPRPMMKLNEMQEEPREFYRPYRTTEREVYYYNRSPFPSSSSRGGGRYDDRYYEDVRYRKPERRYESSGGSRHVEMEMMVDRREPHESRRYRRYEDERHHRSSPPPPSSDAYFGYPNDTPGGLSSRSFDSRSLGEMEDPMNSLLYRPSFSWERGLDMPVDYDAPPLQNNVLVQIADQQRIMKALAMRNEIRTIGNPHSSIGLILLLAMPNDRHCLSETLCIIRNNVEVFTATPADINAPAPGRKRPIQVGQVGLRCVYCRMCTSDRVKRATCFPSSTKRIYRSVIDMKLDHFPHCPYIPPGLKARLEELSANSSRSTGMTVQYFIKSAKELGMVDMEEGIFIDLKRVGMREDQHQPYHAYPTPALPPPEHIPSRVETTVVKAPNKVQFKSKPAPVELDPSIKRYHGKVLLSLPDDASFLSPLRCFLRRNVCAFTATATDIAVRTPTTFSVRVGQVGVGCVHCLSVPPKQRSNRAVCFPFTLARIYQSVADIQRFHLGECKMMPKDVRAEFLKLQSESAKGSRGLATRTYWTDSARKVGLADGPGGMYFCRDPALPPPKEDESSGLLAQVATNAKTNFKPLVTPEDKPTIAEFLYVVMEQLQPCLFTDADRNKRRSKNLGSIGVECKHCAGKIDSRKFFWSSVSAAESNFVSVHSHMMDCKYISDDFKKELAKLKALRREQTSRLKTGSQKAFFTRVWDRLHSNNLDGEKMDETHAAKKEKTASELDTAMSSSKTDMLPPAILHQSKSIENDLPFDSMVLPSAGSNDDFRALLESKSTLSSMPSIEELTKPDTIDAADEIKPHSDTKDGSGDSAIAIKSSLSSVAHELSAVSVRSKEAEQESKSPIAEV